MALPKEYSAQGCSLSRSLEVVGERWTLLIVRDAFYGVRRFGDFADHLGIPRAVLAERLKELVERGVLTKSTDEGAGRTRYELTDAGLELWPIVYGLTRWGDDNFAADGAPRLFEHVEDGGRLAADLTCETCHRHVDIKDIQAVPGPGVAKTAGTSAVHAALESPHRLLQPLP
jgi:DNA-binding HxlR family transcriptional regulator